MKKIKKFKRAFTLVEIMAATAIMIVLIMFVTNIAVDMLRAYENTNAAISANYTARCVLDPLEEDIASAKIFEDGKRWFEVRYDESDIGNLEKASAPRIMFFGQPADRVRRAISGSKSNLASEIQGDFCAICYKLVQKTPFGNAANSPENYVYAVYRAVLNAKDTSSAAVPYVVGANGKSSNADQQTPNSFWESNEPITDPSDEKSYSASEWTTQLQNFVASGILDLSMIFWYDDLDDGKRKIAIVNNSRLIQYVKTAFNNSFDVRTFSSSISVGKTKIAFDGNVSGAINAKLRAIDVSITVLDDALKDRLSAQQKQSSSETISDEKFEEILQQGTTFTRSFRIISD